MNDIILERYGNISVEKLLTALPTPSTYTVMAPCITTSKYNIFSHNMIVNVEFYPPATKMTFIDGTVITTIAQEGDEFNKETGMMTCIMEYIFKGKQYNNMLRKWIKKDERRTKEIIAKKEKEKEAKEIKQRQYEKEKRRQAARAARAKERAIEIQTEAYLRAMQKMKDQESEQIARDSE